MKILFILACAWIMAETMADEDLVLDGNSFLITNKVYERANLAQWGRRGRDAGTHEQQVVPDQFWMLEEVSSAPGYYYIHNLQYQGYRLAKWGSGGRETGVYNGQYHRDQQWRFVKEGDYYRIYNRRYSTAKLAKWGKSDWSWGTYSWANHDDQLWKLTPRFEANINRRVVWQIDNREATHDVPHIVQLTRGLTLTQSETVTTKVGLETALTASIEMGIPFVGDASFGMTTTLTTEVTNSISHGEERSWTESYTTTYTAPAGKNYRVIQMGCDLNSPLAADDMYLFSTYLTVEESDEDFTDL